MSTPHIVQKENPVLRMIAQEVDVPHILASSEATRHFQTTITDMIAALDSQEDGVAIAAPQIGISQRIFIVSKRVFELIKSKRTPENMVFINPVIIKVSKEKKDMEEGCLSVRWLYGQVSRSTKVTIEAYNETGTKFRMGASGLLAQIFQHETDHLNGVLFIDSATDLEEIPPKKDDADTKEQKKNLKK